VKDSDVKQQIIIKSQFGPISQRSLLPPSGNVIVSDIHHWISQTSFVGTVFLLQAGGLFIS
jgi:hypothetical protein